MICEACRERRHDDCRGGTWCDCQHLPPPGDGHDREHRPGPDAGDRTEPDVNWLRQG
jgi:hypothetical protein